MKYSLVIALIFIVFTSCKENKEMDLPKDEIISIYVQNQKSGYQDIIILGKVVGDSIEKITDWDDEKNDYVNNRKPYLEKYSEYFIKTSDSTLKIKTTEIITKEFQCSPVTVGHSDKYILKIKDEFNVATNYPNFTNLLIKGRDEDVDNETFHIIADKIKNLFESKGIAITNSLVLEFMQSVDLDNDNVDEVLVKGKTGEMHNESSVLLIFNITKDYIKQIGEIESWQKGYNLIGVTDLNRNGKLELIFQGVGYESVGFEIYEISADGFIKLLYTVPYGC